MSKNKVITNLIWRFAERCGAQGVAFVVGIVLARLLEPKLYGTISLVTAFTAVLQVFVDSGMGNALIQKKDADDLDFSTVFYFNVCSCTVLYLVMFVAAPYIAMFYADATLTPVIRVLSVTLLISGVKNIQQAYVSRTMQFKRFFFSTLGGTIGAAIVGIAMAYHGFGVWALVAQQVFNPLVDTIILWFTVKWKPKCCFSFARLKGLLSYGWKLLASALLEAVYNNSRQLMIGKLYSSSDLAYYNKGTSYPSLAILNINTSIDSVLFPKMSSSQDSPERIKDMTRKSIQVSSYLVWPLMIGLLVCAEPVIVLLLTEKWLPCVPYMQLFCFSYAFWPSYSANLSAIKAVGRSDVFLKIEIIKKIIGIVSILISFPFGVIWIAIAYAVTAPINGIINAYPNRALLGYTFMEQLADMLPPMLLSGAMGLCVYSVSVLTLPAYVTLIIQVIVGATIYTLGSAIFKMKSFYYVLGVVKGFWKK